MSFNSDSRKPAREVIKKKKKKKKIAPNPPITFNNVPVKHVQFRKHVGLTLDSKVDFYGHSSSIFSKVNKLAAVLRKLQTVLPRHFPFTIYEAFIRPH